MACTDYEIKLFDQFGRFLYKIEHWSTLNLHRIKNDIGTLTLVLPGSKYSFTDFNYDYRCEIYRKGKLVGNTCWFLQRKEQALVSDCDIEITLIFADTIDIINRRVNAWYACDAPQCFSTIQSCADDMMKMLMQFNFGELVNPPNDPVGYPLIPFNVYIMTVQPGDDDPTYQWLTPATVLAFDGIYNESVERRQMTDLNIEGYRSEGLVVTQECSFINILEVLQDIADASLAISDENSNIWFDIEYSPATLYSPAYFIFKTWVGVRGNDYRNDVFIGPDFNNFSNPVFIDDFSNKADIAYIITDSDATGQTVGSVYLDTVENAYFYNVPFGPIEIVTDVPTQTASGDIIDEDILTGEGQTALGELAKTKSMTGSIINSATFDFMTHYNFGDILTLSWGDVVETAEIAEFTITVDASGIETIDVPVNLL